MEQTNPTNLFNVFLNAADALGGITTDSSVCRFDIGSILAQAPNAEELENAGTCLIKVKYFQIEKTSDEFSAANIGLVQIRLVNQYPNNIESATQSTKYKNMISSNIIGVVGVGNPAYTYSDFQSNPNDYVAIANPFKNQIEIQLTNEGGASLGPAFTANKEWVLWLCVYVPPQVDILNKNMPALNY
tara:strand:- start:1364 stop:1924 length:561 start_codon:yes stop_codon:yes gene_type:complete